jgi:hypothetical protein
MFILYCARYCTVAFSQYLSDRIPFVFAFLYRQLSCNRAQHYRKETIHWSRCILVGNRAEDLMRGEVGGREWGSNRGG